MSEYHDFSNGLSVGLRLEAKEGVVALVDTATHEIAYEQTTLALCPIEFRAIKGRMRNVRHMPWELGMAFLRWLETYTRPERTHEKVPDILELRQHLGTEFFGRERNKALAKVLGPKFPQRWYLANQMAFIKPVEAALSPMLVQRYFKNWPKGTYSGDRLQWALRYRSVLHQLVQDGYGRMLPLLFMHYGHLRGTEMLGGMPQHPLQALREIYGKQTWLKLCQAAPSRLLDICRLVDHMEAYRGVHMADRNEIVTLLVDLPSTLIRNSEHLSSLLREQLELVVNLSKHRVFPFKDAREYRRVATMWWDVRRFRGEASPLWSVRRITDEHHRFVAAQREQDRRRLLAEASAADEVFTIPYCVPFDVSLLQLEDGAVYSAHLLRTKRQYVDQGTQEQHCVGSYATQGARGQYYTYDIRRNGHTISTLMFDSRGQVVQHYGKRNSHVTDVAAHLLEDVLEKAIQAQLPVSASRRKRDVNLNEEDF